MKADLVQYKNLLADIKSRIRQGQWQANLSANAEMLATYWDIGRMIDQRQKAEGWGKGVIPRLAKDLKNDLSEEKGFSERNLQFMVQFYLEYPNVFPIAKLPVSQLETQLIKQEHIFNIGWAHHIILIQKIKDLPTRTWYMQQNASNGWSRDVLVNMIKSKLHLRQGKTANNFERTLPSPQSGLA